MANVFQDQVNATGGFGGGGFGGFGGTTFGVPVGVPVGGFGGFGGGFAGGGALGIEALILLALFGRDGFGRDGGHCRDGGTNESTAALATVIAALNDRGNNDRCETMLTAILAKLGSVEGALPAISCELQSAITNATIALTAQGNANAASLTAQLNALQLSNQVQTTTILQAVSDVNNNVDRQGCATREAVAASTTTILNAIKDGQIQSLRDDKIILANENAELRSDARHREHRAELDGLRISIENNNTAVAQQAQFQRQRQDDLTFARIERDNHDLRCQLAELIQINRATNQNILVGNTGVTATGPQNANPTNVNAR